MELAWVSTVRMSIMDMWLTTASNHQPLHAIVVLLNEVSTTQDSQTSEKIRNVIDVIFALANENAGLCSNVSQHTERNARVLHEGGSEVWRFLKRLRARAWRKRNWDPGNGLSREQATTLCQSWFASDGQNIEPLSAFNENQQPAEAGTSYVPMMDFLEHDFLYSQDFTLPDVMVDDGMYEDAGQNWVDNL